jgi:glycosyltransferase involved in cell wall biosynthesis
LDILVDAFLLLKEGGKFPELRLEVAGGMTAEDEPFVDEQRRKLRQAGFSDFSSIKPNIDRKEKLNFLRNLSVFSVPARYPEAFGLYVVEALAAGVPVVLPDSGAFPELVEQSQGGRLYKPNDPGTLCESLESLLVDPEQSKKIGLKGHDVVSKDFANESLASRLIDNVLSPLQEQT